MQFGLRNAAQTFQWFMEQVFQGLHFAYAYIDVLIASFGEEEHIIIYSRFLTVSRSLGLS